jgi:signal transduction histidine kinase
LGLAYVKKQMETTFNGELLIASEPHVGTTVTLRFPHHVNTPSN